LPQNWHDEYCLLTKIDAVTGAAELFGIENLSGTIEAGATADIIAVLASPLEDIAVMQNVPYVIKSGRIVKRNGEMHCL
jgi:imidazolonepropionase-like amidohydrolase